MQSPSRSARFSSGHGKFEACGAGGYKVPVYFLDALPENTDYDRTLTHFLYSGDLSVVPGGHSRHRRREDA
ncbi:MAG: hypothetical protein WBV90_06805, partial [Terrimicrobiaceae bacterium]